MQIVGLAIGTIVAYIFGTAWLAIEAHLTFYLGIACRSIPYIPGDLVKIILVVLAGPIVKKDYNLAAFFCKHYFFLILFQNILLYIFEENAKKNHIYR